MNFYNVTISECCKKGPRTLFSFVVKSENSQNEVYLHYLAQYQHLNVRVDEIGDVKNLELPKTENCAAYKQDLTAIKLDHIALTPAEKETFKAWQKARSTTNALQRDAENAIKSRLINTFGVLSNGIRVDIVPSKLGYSSDDQITATIGIAGKISDGLKLFEKMAEPTEAEVANEKEI